MASWSVHIASMPSWGMIFGAIRFDEFSQRRAAARFQEEQSGGASIAALEAKRARAHELDIAGSIDRQRYDANFADIEWQLSSAVCLDEGSVERARELLSDIDQLWLQASESERNDITSELIDKGPY